MVTIDDFRKLEFKIAQIKAVEPHPNADKLYILRIQVGETEKSIVAGIRPFYQIGELIGKKIVVVANLEPAVIRGVESQGMLLAASEGEILSLVIPEREIPTGAKVR